MLHRIRAVAVFVPSWTLWAIIALDCAADSLQPSFTKIRSPSGRWEVFGTNQAHMVLVLRWATEIGDRASRIIGAPSDDKILTRILLPPFSCAEDVPVCRSFVTNDVLVQRLDLARVDDFYLIRTVPWLCGLLLENMSGVQGKEICKTIPPWLSVGLAQNLYQINKAWNCAEMLGRWRAGAVPSLYAILRTVMQAGFDSGDHVACGALVTWILSLPRGTECLGALTCSIDLPQGELHPEWFLRWVDDCHAVSDLDEKWEKWLINQRTTVYQAGVSTPSLVRELELSMYFVTRDGSVLSPTALISSRNDESVGVAASERSQRVRLMAIGRDETFQRAACTIADFLDAIASKEVSNRRLQLLLSKANKALKQAFRNAEKAWPVLPLGGLEKEKH